MKNVANQPLLQGFRDLAYSNIVYTMSLDRYLLRIVMTCYTPYLEVAVASYKLFRFVFFCGQHWNGEPWIDLKLT